MNLQMEKRVDEIEALARKFGLDPFPVTWEEVPREIIWEVASYGLPTRMSHWSFGRSYVHQKMNGEMGFGKIYELILNNNPSYAFLDNSNSDVVNLLIVAHCYAHSDFFKHNICFSKSNRSMVNTAERNARTIEEYKNVYGVEVVEDWMDIAFALDRHIDTFLGENRVKYPEAHVVSKEIQPLPYADIFGEDLKPRITTSLKNEQIPPHPEKDFLWFLVSYANMLPWQKEVFSIIRSESFYFYPQAMTKIMNEGWASFWHAELMLNYANLSASEHLEFSKMHSSVVNAGGSGSINPYYLGFRVLTDIKARWDKYYEEGKKSAAFQASNDIDHYDKDGKIDMSKMTGYEKMFKVRIEDDDTSFIRNYLTKELATDLNLFTYGHFSTTQNSNPDEDDIVIKERALDHIHEAMTNRMLNYGMPPVAITKIRPEDGALIMDHDKADGRMLDEKYTQETLKYIYSVWKRDIILNTYDRYGKGLTYTYSKGGSTCTRAPSGVKQIRLNM